MWTDELQTSAVWTLALRTCVVTAFVAQQGGRVAMDIADKHSTGKRSADLRGSNPHRLPCAVQPCVVLMYVAALCGYTKHRRASCERV